jgi:hypothetical protein
VPSDGAFHKVFIPFSSFSNKWSSATGTVLSHSPALNPPPPPLPPYFLTSFWSALVLKQC